MLYIMYGTISSGGKMKSLFAAIWGIAKTRVKLRQVKSEPQNIEYRMSKGGIASLSHFLLK
jgi:hypothetical protein